MDCNIERYGLVQAPGRPVMSLATACDEALTVCLTAADRTADAGGQTQEILATIDGFLEQAGTGKSQLLTAQVWLRDMNDMSAFTAAWNAWIDHAAPPACSIVGAHMARPDILVEIKVTAARTQQ